MKDIPQERKACCEFGMKWYKVHSHVFTMHKHPRDNNWIKLSLLTLHTVSL